MLTKDQGGREKSNGPHPAGSALVLFAQKLKAALPVGCKNWLFAGSDRGGERAASMYTLIATAKLNNIDPQAWLTHVLPCTADHPARQLHELLPWNWHAPTAEHAAAA
jgi:transposase